MPKRSNDFQKLIAAIESHLAPFGAIVTESKMLKEKGSETEREIDIAVESSLGQHSVMIAVECRDHKRRADIEWIDSLIGKYQNLPVEKVVAVSRSGFTGGAIKKAAEVNISTVTLEDAIEAKIIPNVHKRIIPVISRSPGPPNTEVLLKLDDYEKYGEYNGDLKRGRLRSPVEEFNGILNEVLKSKVIKTRYEEIANSPAPIEDGPMKPIKITFPEGTVLISDDDIGYGLREVTVAQSMTTKITQLELSAFRYMDVELLSGDIQVDDVKLHILRVYEDGKDAHQYYFRAEGEIVSLKFGTSEI